VTANLSGVWTHYWRRFNTITVPLLDEGEESSQEWSGKSNTLPQLLRCLPLNVGPLLDNVNGDTLRKGIYYAFYYETLAGALLPIPQPPHFSRIYAG
jgi:hypothetical protein